MLGAEKKESISLLNISFRRRLIRRDGKTYHGRATHAKGDVSSLDVDTGEVDVFVDKGVAVAIPRQLQHAHMPVLAVRHSLHADGVTESGQVVAAGGEVELD